MPIIAKIGVTGGPAGGKTYFTTYSKQHFIKSGLKPVYVSEVATLFQGYGIGPLSNVLDNIEYQYMIAKYQLSTEKTLIKSLEKSKENILLIFDRTLLDGKAYCTDEEWKIVLERLKLKEHDIYDRYDLILHFVTTAIGKFSSYSTENNPARHESEKQAIERENLNVAAYNGMPIFKKIYLNNNVGMEEKQNQAVNIVLGFLNIARPIFGRQQRYLVKKITKEKILKFLPKQIHILQDYLSVRDDEIERRVRCITDGDSKIYYYTEKNKEKAVSFEKQIKLEEYFSYLKDKKIGTSTISKDRFYFEASNLYFQYDEFACWKNFAILEVQPTNICPNVIIPEEFEVIENITECESFSNNLLAENMYNESDLKNMHEEKLD